MKELFLIRHAKSDWDHAGLSDHDRPLNDRGKRDAPRMAEALRRLVVSPAQIVTSTATRAATTAELLAEGLGFPVAKIDRVPGLYLATPQAILRVVQGLDEEGGTALVFGHNPGMHETVNLLSGEMMVEHFPTLAVAHFELAVECWGEVEWGDGRLREMLTPRGLPDVD